MIDKMELSSKAYKLRKDLGEDLYSPIDIFSLVQKIENLTLIFYPLGKNMSGICYKGKESKVIVINSDMSIGRQRFSLAHEFYHLYYDEDMKTTISMTKIGIGDDKEREADLFASYFLIPQCSLDEISEKYKKNPIVIEDVIKLEQYYGVSHQAMLYRLLNQRLITKIQVDEMQSGIIGLAARLGYDISLYQPSEEGKRTLVLGYYISKVEALFEKDLISNGKYEELLLDAFRDDIVYGSDEDGGKVLD